ncbi:MAG: hypothetical protein DRP64_04395 [Verrucomicrobia bacterium]|nr:MAG: hypothetical protein DRP64_04395 [Verrucomicrobiota bacterium]
MAVLLARFANDLYIDWRFITSFRNYQFIPECDSGKNDTLGPGHNRSVFLDGARERQLTTDKILVTSKEKNPCKPIWRGLSFMSIFREEDQLLLVHFDGCQSGGAFWISGLGNPIRATCGVVPGKHYDGDIFFRAQGDWLATLFTFCPAKRNKLLSK